MTSTPGRTPAAQTRYPREIAAAVTLRAACAALVAPTSPADVPHTDRLRSATVRTACGALATRFAILRFLTAVDRPDPRTVVPFDPFREPTPPALRGEGPAPDGAVVRSAGDRLTAAWQAWRRDGPSSVDDAIAAAGALAVGAWCAWALGSSARAEVRARHALDTWSDDPLAALVLRSVRLGVGPSWDRTPSRGATGRTGSSTVE
ncbi:MULTISPECIES: hypothetical protein [unclassified Curtobacterium]|uniref:hypothetical protein n=1 Tax=unclassified Curtobacterium TaxID=257496 RepID=UPI000825E733|nr:MULTISPECIES: hypothetical protein [unclassified Curtobacterium]WIA95417.1 hypothetical protein QOL16_09720 [Curtobacterium sp. MCBA15_004]WIA98783.1 hypothetical protein QOL15_09455 [Curtobacterium sp. MCBA15_012]